MNIFFYAICISGCLFCLVIACCAFTPRSKKISTRKAVNQSEVRAELGNTLADLLLDPASVTCYSVKGKEKITPDDIELEPHYVRDSLCGSLSPEAISVLTFLLTSDMDNYSRDSVLIKSPYMPEIEFSFTRRKQEAHVLVSMTNFSWTVIYDGKKQFNYNYVDKRNIARFCEMILKNEE